MVLCSAMVLHRLGNSLSSLLCIPSHIEVLNSLQQAVIPVALYIQCCRRVFTASTSATWEAWGTALGYSYCCHQHCSERTVGRCSIRIRVFELMTGYIAPIRDLYPSSSQASTPGLVCASSPPRDGIPDGINPLLLAYKQLPF